MTVLKEAIDNLEKVCWDESSVLLYRSIFRTVLFEIWWSIDSNDMSVTLWGRVNTLYKVSSVYNCLVPLYYSLMWQSLLLLTVFFFRS